VQKKRATRFNSTFHTKRKKH